jgi:hypothetical protein
LLLQARGLRLMLCMGRASRRISVGSLAGKARRMIDIEGELGGLR